MHAFNDVAFYRGPLHGGPLLSFEFALGDPTFKRMIPTILSIALMLLSVPLIATIRLVSRERAFTLQAFLTQCLIQLLLFGVVLWITSLLGPVGPSEIATTTALVAFEVAFRGVRAWAKS